MTVFRSWKSVRIRSYSGPYFPAFGLNTKRYFFSLRIIIIIIIIIITFILSKKKVLLSHKYTESNWTIYTY